VSLDGRAVTTKDTKSTKEEELIAKSTNDFDFNLANNRFVVSLRGAKVGTKFD
jgi:hypothetical protein